MPVSKEFQEDLIRRKAEARGWKNYDKKYAERELQDELPATSPGLDVVLGDYKIGSGRDDDDDE